MKHLIAACLAGLVAAGCQSAAASHDKADAKPDPRQGKQVSQVCFSQQIRNWRANDRDSVIIEKGFKQEYKLDLIGTCQPEDAFSSIGLISRVGGGSCLTVGDKLVTDARYTAAGPCSIQRIYEWHKDAGKTPAAAPTPTPAS